jgi:hypothetical protein
MNRLRYSLFAALLVISSSTFALGGDIQGPGKTDPAATPTRNALTTVSTSGALIQPTSTEDIQIAWPDATMFVDILLTIF